MADKSVSISITLPESVCDVLKSVAFDLEASRSEIIAHCLEMQLPVLRQHPMLLKYCEFEQVKQHLNGAVKAA